MGNEGQKKFHIGLLPRLIIAIVLGVVVGTMAKSAGMPLIIQIGATFNSIFGNFLGFCIPLIIIGLDAVLIAIFVEYCPILLSLGFSITISFGDEDAGERCDANGGQGDDDNGDGDDQDRSSVRFRTHEMAFGEWRVPGRGRLRAGAR